MEHAQIEDTEIFFLGSLAQDTKGQIKTPNLLWPLIVLESLSIMAKMNPTGRKNNPLKLPNA